MLALGGVVTLGAARPLFGAFRAAGAGCTLVWRQVTSPLRPNLGHGGGSPSGPLGWVPGLLVVALASKVSTLTGWGSERRTRPPPPLLWPLARGSASERPATLSSSLKSLSLFFFSPHPKECREKVELGPQTLSFVSGVIGRPPASGASHSHQLFVESGHRFPLVWCVGSSPQGQLKEWNACRTHLGLERRNGGWEQPNFPSSKPPLVCF